jgi:hypothetical protein
VSFAVPFQDLVNRLALRGITGVDQTTSFRYVLGTGTNASTLSQDIAGLGLLALARLRRR